MKKALSLILTCAFMLASTMCVLASSTLDYTPIDIWRELREEGYLYVDSDGMLNVLSNAFIDQCDTYPEFLRLVEECNDSIQKGILEVDTNTLQLKSVATNIPQSIQEARKVPNKKSGFVTYGGMHGCSETDLNLLLLCQNNYNTIESYYDDMLNLSVINPDLDPWTSTVSYWVGKVQEYGEWDYKRNPYYEPYNRVFCAYYDGEFHHITSEFLGNFNYGYTGSFLFDLTTLHLGSFAASGFSTTDYDDWEAIDAGYYSVT